MSSEHNTEDMAGRWLARELSEQEQQQWEDLLAEDADFAAQMRSLEEVAQAVRELPPELFIDGPSEDYQLMARRVTTAARSNATGAQPQDPTSDRHIGAAAAKKPRETGPGRRWWLTAAACALLAAGAGVVAGGSWERRSGETIAAPTPTVTVTATPAPTPPPPNVVTAANRNEETGAAMQVRLTPAAGWVRVQVTVTGIPAGQRCRIWVVSQDGQRELAGSWLVSPKGAQEGTTLDGSAIIDPDQVTNIIIENTAGTPYITVPI